MWKKEKETGEDVVVILTRAKRKKWKVDADKGDRWMLEKRFRKNE